MSLLDYIVVTSLLLILMLMNVYTCNELREIKHIINEVICVQLELED
jgi:hypothetical protein